jgi:hypothetical protein
MEKVFISVTLMLLGMWAIYSVVVIARLEKRVSKIRLDALESIIKEEQRRKNDRSRTETEISE